MCLAETGFEVSSEQYVLKRKSGLIEQYESEYYEDWHSFHVYFI